MASEIIYKEESHAIIGACMRVHSALGAGFLESVYVEALGKELESSGIVFEKEKKLRILFGNVWLDKYFKIDFVCYEDILLEIKAVSFLIKDFERQVLNYLKASNKRLGLLVNFGEKSLVYKRIINPNIRDNHSQ
ncbi:GxxExxY protein [Niabella ginsengisoli]|uniref:GxxExxY protein n=1 Tax=Niabella ginsengisoli TaxID=522298 RepID=A0ABS9SDU1_9BACT|nr:GxxExxY protein [Niabella ginsengisoli]MCH5596527.1 GxxExxY protein [Niabella ginsengisoli]